MLVHAGGIQAAVAMAAQCLTTLLLACCVLAASWWKTSPDYEQLRLGQDPKSSTASRGHRNPRRAVSALVFPLTEFSQENKRV